MGVDAKDVFRCLWRSVQVSGDARDGEEREEEKRGRNEGRLGTGH